MHRTRICRHDGVARNSASIGCVPHIKGGRGGGGNYTGGQIYSYCGQVCFHPSSTDTSSEVHVTVTRRNSDVASNLVQYKQNSLSSTRRSKFVNVF